jgi:N-carbamoyl-L-amino-acid hydrolase
VRLSDRVRADRIAADLAALAELTRRDDSGYTRLAFSDEDRRGRAWLRQRMAAGGLTARLDAAGNIIGRREAEGRPGGAPSGALAIGSHIDTVPHGGRFDGVAGVVAGLEVARVLSETRRHTRHPLEVIAFTGEEVSPFGISAVGSRAMAGKLVAAQARELRDPDGRTLAEAIDSVGGDAARLELARRPRGALAHYLELHIEQGPVLDRERAAVGVVTGLTAGHRLRVRLGGRPDHAGTTPMAMRRDALGGAAEVALALERVASETPDTVGTVDSLTAHPNRVGVVPAQVEMLLEFRSASPDRIATQRKKLLHAIDEIARRRGLDVSWEFVLEERPVPIAAETVALAAAVCQELGIAYRRLASGVSHDAGQIAEIAPVALLFVPSVGGRSHCPEELTRTEDLAAGTRALLELLLRLDTHP